MTTEERMPFQRRERAWLVFAATVWILRAPAFGVGGGGRRTRRGDRPGKQSFEGVSIGSQAVIHGGHGADHNQTARRPPAEAIRSRGTPFEDLFDQSPGYSFRQPNVPLPGMGSGVIIGQGIVLTNNHVVEGADEVTIDLSDGRRLPVREVKTDPQTDLAVLSFVADEPHPVARLGDSDELDIGDWVIAVGNPFELEQTVSAGIISAKGRSLGSVERARFLQTDAAINPGNSGGRWSI